MLAWGTYRSQAQVPCEGTHRGQAGPLGQACSVFSCRTIVSGISCRTTVSGNSCRVIRGCKKKKHPPLLLPGEGARGHLTASRPEEGAWTRRHRRRGDKAQHTSRPPNGAKRLGSGTTPSGGAVLSSETALALPLDCFVIFLGGTAS
ncbi:unnamed protein product [Parnassius apollo]|uniref:(apollo) hypothetical protein n=1 Tax=Parnassius apollo TaxID=110799 RepID=A0A8S3YHB8_PARAO|nr:unnamed protein product [Parnassius apollo]